MYSVVTHDGNFHADECLAIAILEVAFDEELEIVRTRNEDKIENADIVVDVGKEYHPAEEKYDHHQVESPSDLARMNGVPYASAGLIWQTYGGMLTEHVDLVDELLIQGIDAIDTGWDSPKSEEDVRHTSLSGLVASLNPNPHETINVRDQFEKAVELCKTALFRTIENANAKVTSIKKIEEAPRVDIGGGYTAVVLEEYRNPELVEFEGNEAFLVFPDGDWRVMQIPNPKRPMEPRFIGHPEDIRGMDGEELQEQTGVDDAVFAHNAGFIAIAETREGALALARYAT